MRHLSGARGAHGPQVSAVVSRGRPLAPPHSHSWTRPRRTPPTHAALPGVLYSSTDELGDAATVSTSFSSSTPATNCRPPASCPYFGPLGSLSVADLERLYSDAKQQYYDGVPIVADAVFDDLELRLREARSEVVRKYPRCSLTRSRWMYADADEDPDHEGSLSVLWQMLALLGVLMVVVPGAVALSHFSPFSPLSPYSPLSSISGMSGSGGVNNGEEMRVGGNDGVSSAPAVAIDPSGLGRTASSPSTSVSTSPRSSFTNTNRFRNRSVRALTSNHVTRAGASTPDPNPLGFLVLATGLFAGTSLFQTCQRALAKIRSGDTHALHGQCPNCGEDVWQFLDSPGAGGGDGGAQFCAAVVGVPRVRPASRVPCLCGTAGPLLGGGRRGVAHRREEEERTVGVRSGVRQTATTRSEPEQQHQQQHLVHHIFVDQAR